MTHTTNFLSIGYGIINNYLYGGLFAVVLFVPAGEGLEALAEGGVGAEVEVALEGGGVGVGGGDVAGLHWD